MQITAIEPRRKGLCALYIDGEFAMKLDAETVLAHRFDTGREITDEELHECVTDSQNKRCKDKAMWLISYRDHSRRELIEKLCRDWPSDCAEAAADRLEQLGLIDDSRYARRLAADLMNIKNLSERGIRQKLREKGIDRDLIDEAVDELDIDERGQLARIIEEKYARSLSDEKTRRRAADALARMGYSYSDIKSAMAEYIDSDEDC